MIWRKLYSRERLLKSFRYDFFEEACFQVKIHWKLKTLFTWWRGRSFFFKNEDIKNVMIWWLRKNFFEERRHYKGYDFMIWRSLYSGESILKNFWYDVLEEASFPEERYRKRYGLLNLKNPIFKWKDTANIIHLMTWKKFFSKKKDNKNVIIWWFGVILYSGEMIRKKLQSDGTAEVFFQMNKH